MQRLLYRKTIKGQNLNRNQERGGGRTGKRTLTNMPTPDHKKTRAPHTQAVAKKRFPFSALTSLLQTNVQGFKRKFAEYLGAKHAICISNGTVSLEIALLAMGVGKSDEVRARAWAVGLWG
jgi:hypothetical protein